MTTRKSLKDESSYLVDHSIINVFKYSLSTRCAMGLRLLLSHHQMVNTEIRLIIFFADKDGEALYSQQKQDQELTVAQIMNSLLPNSDLN